MTTKYRMEIRDGLLTPDMEGLREAMAVLRKQLKRDEKLRNTWKRNPRTVLADRGLNRILQNQVLQEEGRVVRWTRDDRAMASGCYGCTGCCCTGCCVTSINLADRVSNPASGSPIK